MQRVVVEAQRRPAPPHPTELVRLPRRLGFADRANAPRTIAGRDVPLGRDRDRVAVDTQFSRPCADAREARRVEQDAVAVAPDVLRLRDRSVRRFVREVEADAVLVGVAHDAHLVERLDHLDAIRADLLEHLVVGSRARRADGPLPIAAAHGRVRVDHPEVRVHAHAGDEERVGLAVDALVDAPVVDVAVAARDVAHRQRDLVDRIFVERVELQHRNLQSSSGRAEATRHGANAAPNGRLRTTVKHTTATSTARAGNRSGGTAPDAKTRDAHARYA